MSVIRDSILKIIKFKNKGECVKIKKQLILLISFLFLLIVFSNCVFADQSVIYVNDSGGNDSWTGESSSWDGLTLLGPKQSIKNATGTVSQGGTINIADGVYSGENNTNITIDKNMTIIGQSMENTIINGDNSAGIFTIQNGINATILNLTLINGNATQIRTLENENVTVGGAIFNAGNLTVLDSVFTGNTANWGGAIGNIGTVTLNDCIFANNSAHTFVLASSYNGFMGSAYGGAIYNYYDSVVTANDCAFTDNYALNGNNINNGFSYGGAIYNGGARTNTNYGILDIFDSIFINNTATSEGGAIFNWDIMTVNGSIFEDNHAKWGGAIDSYFSANVIDCIFLNNTATGPEYGYGGAISSGGTTSIDNSVFIGNIATTNGGAINNGGACTINGTIFLNNTAYGTGTYDGGGAIHHLSVNQPLTIRFSSFVGNNALRGNNIHCSGVATILDANYNWWGNNSGPEGIISSYGELKSWPTTWLVLNITASPDVINNLTNSTITVDLTHDNNGNYHDPTDGHVPDGILVTFETTLGTIDDVSFLIDGTTESTLSGDAVNGIANVSAAVDNQIVQKSVIIVDPNSPTVNSIDPANNAKINNNNKVITITFSKPIKAGSAYDNISVTGASGLVSITRNINNNILTLTPNSNYADGIYNINIPVNAVTDLANVSLEEAFSSNFTLDTVLPTVNVTPAGGKYYNPLSVTLNSSKSANIYYTLDGSDPTENSKLYLGPINLTTSKVLKFFAVDDVGNPSKIYTESYSIYTWSLYSYPVTIQYRLSNKKYRIKYSVPYKAKKRIRTKVGNKWKYTYIYVTKYKTKYKWDYRYGYRTETRWAYRWQLT